MIATHPTPCWGLQPQVQRRSSKNIARGQASVISVMTAWLNAEGHRKNIYNAAWDKVGLGHCQKANGQDHRVAMFIRDP